MMCCNSFELSPREAAKRRRGSPSEYSTATVDAETVEGIRAMIRKGSHVSVSAKELADMFAELQALRRGGGGIGTQQQKQPCYSRAPSSTFAPLAGKVARWLKPNF